MKKFNGIIEIRTVRVESDVNRALELGWKIVEIVKETESEQGWFSSKQRTKIRYVVGRPQSGIPDPENWIEYPDCTEKPSQQDGKT